MGDCYSGHGVHPRAERGSTLICSHRFLLPTLCPSVVLLCLGVQLARLHPREDREPTLICSNRFPFLLCSLFTHLFFFFTSLRRATYSASSCSRCRRHSHPCGRWSVCRGPFAARNTSCRYARSCQGGGVSDVPEPPSELRTRPPRALLLLEFKAHFLMYSVYLSQSMPGHRSDAGSLALQTSCLTVSLSCPCR